jgi:hypothetical protein
MADLCLVGVDGSEGSRRALRSAAERARLSGASGPYAALA